MYLKLYIIDWMERASTGSMSGIEVMIGLFLAVLQLVGIFIIFLAGFLLIMAHIAVSRHINKLYKLQNGKKQFYLEYR